MAGANTRPAPAIRCGIDDYYNVVQPAAASRNGDVRECRLLQVRYSEAPTSFWRSRLLYRNNRNRSSSRKRLARLVCRKIISDRASKTRTRFASSCISRFRVDQFLVKDSGRHRSGAGVIRDCQQVSHKRAAHFPDSLNGPCRVP